MNKKWTFVGILALCVCTGCVIWAGTISHIQKKEETALGTLQSMKYINSTEAAETSETASIASAALASETTAIRDSYTPASDSAKADSAAAAFTSADSGTTASTTGTSAAAASSTTTTEMTVPAETAAESIVPAETAAELIVPAETAAESTVPADSITEQTSGTESADPPEIPIDFAALQEENPDIYAWITVPGTQVDYAIVQHEDDDSYYLTHNYQFEESAYGAIYTEAAYNSKDFDGPMTLIYGHNMRDKSMFGSLHSFEDRGFFDENREFVIYTEEHIYHYLIFAAYTFSNIHIMANYDFSDEHVFRSYLKDIYSIRSMTDYILDDPVVTIEDKIVTLSTCTGSDHSVRYLIQGVLTEVE